MSEKTLNYSVGLLFILFGVLKLAGETTLKGLLAETVLFIPLDLFLPLLAVWEILIGLCLIYRPLNRLGLYLFIPHILGTFAPIILVPEKVFTARGLTLEGHYILKNIVLVAAVVHTQGDYLLEDWNRLTMLFDGLRP